MTLTVQNRKLPAEVTESLFFTSLGISFFDFERNG